MRNHLVWTALVAVGLVAGAAGLAMAQPNSNANAGAAGSGDAGGHGKNLGNMSAENRTAYVAEMKEARAAALASFKENRTAAHAAWNATMHAIKESYLENKTLVIKSCRGDNSTAKPADMANASKEEKQSFAKCVRDGLRPLKAAARADMEEAREEFRAAMKSAREASLGEFATKRKDAAHRHGRDG